MKFPKLLFALLMMTCLFAFMSNTADAQAPLLTDSATITTGDSTWSIFPGGLYEGGNVTVVGDAVGDTLVFEFLYHTGVLGTEYWGLIDLINLADQTYMNVVDLDASTAYHFQFPVGTCIVGFRVRRTAVTVVAARTTYIYVNFRREY